MHLTAFAIDLYFCLVKPHLRRYDPSKIHTLDARAHSVRVQCVARTQLENK